MTAPISTEVERDLIARWKQGDRAAGAALLAANEALLWKTVGSRAHPSRSADAMQDARLGFLVAVRKYDADKSARLGSYASKCGRGESLRASYEDTTIVVKSSAVFKAQRLERAGKLTEKRALTLKLRSTRSIDAPLRDRAEEFSTLADVLASGDPTPEDLLDAPLAERRRCLLVGQALCTLSPREQEVIRRSELADDPETFADIGRAIGLSRERVRQVHDEAMGKLERVLRRLVTAADAVLWGERRKKAA
jgi:RNA polymerase sigma-32 factor